MERGVNSLSSYTARAAAADDAMTALGPARARFRGLIIPRILAFEEFRKSAGRGGETRNALENIASLAHKISGVGATLGFTSAGDCARTVERTILTGRSRRAAPQAIWSDVEPQLDALLDALEALLGH